MIINLINDLKTKSIILASSSPRRKEIIEKLGLGVEVIPSLFEENLNPDNYDHPSEFVMETAKGKTEDISQKIGSKQHVDLLIGADTCVSLSGKVFGKPRDKDNAIDMLKSLSGKCHEVITGVCLMSKNKDDSWQTTMFHEMTEVTFATLNDDLIEAYVETSEPMDKAGGYGIQGLGGCLIQGINGDYYNVMGFPLHRFTSHLLPILEKWKNFPAHLSNK